MSDDEIEQLEESYQALMQQDRVVRAHAVMARLLTAACRVRGYQEANELTERMIVQQRIIEPCQTEEMARIEVKSQIAHELVLQHDCHDPINYFSCVQEANEWYQVVHGEYDL